MSILYHGETHSKRCLLECYIYSNLSMSLSLSCTWTLIKYLDRSHLKNVHYILGISLTVKALRGCVGFWTALAVIGCCVPIQKCWIQFWDKTYDSVRYCQIVRSYRLAQQRYGRYQEKNLLMLLKGKISTFNCNSLPEGIFHGQLHSEVVHFSLKLIFASRTKLLKKCLVSSAGAKNFGHSIHSDSMCGKNVFITHFL